MPTQWQVWTELVVPLVGAASSFSVAVVAIWVTLRLAKHGRVDAERRRRREWVAAIDRFQRVPADHENLRVLQESALVDLATAGMGLGDVEDIADWVSEVDLTLFSSAKYRQWTAAGRSELIWEKRHRVWAVLSEWAETGIWRRPPVSLAPEDVAAKQDMDDALLRYAARRTRDGENDSTG